MSINDPRNKEIDIAAMKLVGSAPLLYLRLQKVGEALLAWLSFTPSFSLLLLLLGRAAKKV